MTSSKLPPSKTGDSTCSSLYKQLPEDRCEAKCQHSRRTCALLWCIVITVFCVGLTTVLLSRSLVGMSITVTSILLLFWLPRIPYAFAMFVRPTGPNVDDFPPSVEMLALVLGWVIIIVAATLELLRVLSGVTVVTSIAAMAVHSGIAFAERFLWM